MKKAIKWIGIGFVVLIIIAAISGKKSDNTANSQNAATPAPVPITAPAQATTAATPAPAPIVAPAQATTTAAPAPKWNQTTIQLSQAWDNEDFIECKISVEKSMSAFASKGSQPPSGLSYANDIYNLIKEIKLASNAITADQYSKIFEKLNSAIPEGKVAVQSRDANWNKSCIMKFGKINDSINAPVAAADPQQSTHVSDAKTEWKQNIKYAFMSDGSCKEQGDTMCINIKDYEAACNSAKGVSQLALNSIAVVSSGDEHDLAKAGNFSDVLIRWVNGNRCNISIDATGVINGTSKKASFFGKGVEFALTNDGQMLVRYVDWNH
jgi:hypothetical protein